MARGNCGYDPCTIAKHHQNADPNDGSHDGCLGGADQIAKPGIGDAVEAKFLAQLWPGRQLAWCRRSPKGRSESLPGLHAIRGAVAKSMDRRDGPLDQDRTALHLISKTAKRAGAYDGRRPKALACPMA